MRGPGRRRRSLFLKDAGAAASGGAVAEAFSGDEMIRRSNRCRAGNLLLAALVVACSGAATRVERADSDRALSVRPQEQAELGTPATADRDEAVPTLSSNVRWEDVTVLVDTPIHLRDGLGSVDADPVGFLRKGATVFVVGEEDGYVEVHTSFPGPPQPVLTDRDLRQSLTGARGLGLFGLPVLVPKHSRLRKWSRVNPQESERGYYRVLLNLQGRRLALITCGPTSVLDVSGAYVHVAADYPAGELWGWMITGLLWDPEPGAVRLWDWSCQDASPKDPPQEYLPPSRVAFENAPVEQRIRVGDEFYFPEWQEGRATCRRVRIAQKQPRAKLLLHFLKDDRDFIHARGLVLQGDSVSVHPYRLERDGSLRYTVGGAGWKLRAVRVQDEAIGFVEVGATREESESEIHYFDPRALIWWDKTHNECEERIKAWSSQFDGADRP